MARSPRRELEKDNPTAPQIYQSPRRRVKSTDVAAARGKAKKAAAKK